MDMKLSGYVACMLSCLSGQDKQNRTINYVSYLHINDKNLQRNVFCAVNKTHTLERDLYFVIIIPSIYQRKHLAHSVGLICHNLICDSICLLIGSNYRILKLTYMKLHLLTSNYLSHEDESLNVLL